MSDATTRDELRFAISKKCLTLTGSRIDELAHKWIARCTGLERFDDATLHRAHRDGDHYHITVITSDEMKSLSSSSAIPDPHSFAQMLNLSLQTTNLDPPLFDLGVGCCKEQSYYIILFSPFLQRTRLNLDLPPVDLHITLAFHTYDIHDCRKDIFTMWVKETDNYIFINNIERLLAAKSSPIVREYLHYNHLADLASQQGYLFGSYYQAKYQTDSQAACDILELAASCVSSSKCVPSSPHDINYGELVCSALNCSLYSPQRYHHQLRRFYRSAVDTTLNHYVITFIEMPRNFSFITDTVAGSSIPKSRKALEDLMAIGITHIITVMENPLDESYKVLPLRFHWFGVVDRTPPTLEQMQKMMAIVSGAGEGKVLVHCKGGVGRTATVLAAYLMWASGLSRQDAKRPLIENRKTIMTASQDDFLTSWYSICLSRTLSSTLHISTESSRGSTLREVSMKQAVCRVKFPPLIMCVGYPASGKSTFSAALRESNPSRFIRVNQDEQGRRECERSVGESVKLQDKTVILDRCNLSRVERKEWLEMAHRKKAWVVYFSTPAEECKWRIVRRVGHPTLQNGKGGRLIDTLVDSLEAPTKEEGFEQVFEVGTFESSNELLQRWGCQVLPICSIPEELGLAKFPRTRHILNLGSATRDDLLIPKEDAINIFLNRDVLVEEKIDGANMGISILDNKLVAQNRSHYVNSEYHPQFRYLDKWIQQHSGVLWDLLGSDRFILYGEWCYAEHSIAYASLADWFVAFDMFDRLENKFWSRSRLATHLEGSGISMIPLIAKGSFSSLDSLKALVFTKSQYYDGPVEGIVVRVNEADDLYLETRGKIVRSDFISGNTHWSKHGCNPNGILKETKSSK